MHFVEDTVYFKSIPEFYEKEEDNRKCNTVREMPGVEYSTLLGINPEHIVIQNTETSEDFIREITDISRWKNLVIISWDEY